MKYVEAFDPASVKYQAYDKINDANYRWALSLSKYPGRQDKKWYIAQVYAVNADATYTVSSYADNNGLLQKKLIWQNVQNMYYDFIPFYYTYSDFHAGCHPQSSALSGTSAQLVTNGMHTSNSLGSVWELGNKKYVHSMHPDNWLINTVNFVPPPDYHGEIIQKHEPLTLDYLALGDSFSSGEGDVDWQNGKRVNHYIDGTNVKAGASQKQPDELCHVSNRSYPYLLKQQLNILDTQMKSVACSGAVRLDIQGYDTTWDEDKDGPFTYLGQGKRLSVVGAEQRSAFQNEALLSYIPGRIQQIEFVKTSKPTVITMTLGGNDIGFGSFLRSCVLSRGSPCEAATDDGKKRMGQTIRNKYMALRDAYKSIEDNSPNTKLYIVGYPKCVDEKYNACTTGIALDGAERNMINESLSYLNQVIKAAASEVGAYYIDIEKSLGSHTLCGLSTEQYVNSIGSALLDGQEAFHPNAKGHQAIAQAIQTG